MIVFVIIIIVIITIIIIVFDIIVCGAPCHIGLFGRFVDFCPKGCGF